MNSYNENLRASVSKSLDAQSKVAKSAASELSAQEISLYYAQGALIAANDKFDQTLVQYEAQQDIQTSVNENNNSGINVVDAATLEKKYVDQSISNTATAASNVQVASNTVLRLAGDLGNVFSILQAANYGSEIYDEAFKAKTYMDETAYNAKLASQLAMESTMLAASISSTTVLTEAQSTSAAINTLNTNFKAQFSSTSDLLNAQNDAVVSANNLEKKSEGITEDLNISLYGSLSAYRQSNSKLNNGLRVLPNIPGQAITKTDKKFTAEFTPFIAPFSRHEEITDAYPVATYYIIVVNASSRSTFSVSSADSAISEKPNDKNQLRAFAVQPDTTRSITNPYNVALDTSLIVDSSGAEIKPGTNYCLFLYIKLCDQYKKEINDYNDILSVGSAIFNLTKQLVSPASVDILYKNANNDQIKDKITLGLTDQITFTVNEESEAKVAYKVFLLPTSIGKVGGLMASQNLNSFSRDAIKAANMTALKTDITTVETKIKSLQDAHEKHHAELNSKQNEHKTKLNADGLTADKKKSQQENFKLVESKLNKSIESVANAISSEKAKLIDLKKKLKFHNENTRKDGGVFFNQSIAEQVPAGCYTLAKLSTKTGTNTDNNNTYFVAISPDLTDNFGNKLVTNDSYVPVILSSSTAEESEPKKIANALSDYSTTANFIFNSSKKQ